MVERWRVGRKVPIHLYRQVGPDPSDGDEPVGTMLTPEWAALAADAVNLVAAAPMEAERAVADAIRAACPADEECLADEEACFRAHPIHEFARRDGVLVSVYADVDEVARLALGAVRAAGWVPLSEVLDALRELDPVEAALAGRHAFQVAADILAERFGGRQQGGPT